MRAGYAEAPTARWRVMHELTVIAMFIKMHGSEMAIRYRDHDAVESWWPGSCPS
ncbi:MAG: hypothetical protein HY827_05975 [Actinobacteria bacterium]|nr:hypothetical protein [Actinomycetota bacterium]